jgi:adenine-specific DNA-methyltransferase
VFADDGVLQENVVFAATKGDRPETVTITSSRDHTDEAAARAVPYHEFVVPGDPQRFIRIAADEGSLDAVRLVSSLPASLSSLGVAVSTGRVVDFRARESLEDSPRPGSAPLVYPGNLRQGEVRWPLPINKPQGFKAAGEAGRKALFPGGYYVLVKRFSAKEERRRIAAAVWDPTRHGGQDVAFENHLNVLHAGGAGLDRELALGLSLWLNSSVVDRCFRTFSGHTQVNAADLRSMSYPDAGALRRLGGGGGLDGAAWGELMALRPSAA